MITIRVIQPPVYLLDQFAAPDNAVYLDTDYFFELRYTKGLEQLTEASKITQEAALSISLPATRKNKAILSGERAPMDIELRKSGDPLPGTKLEVVKEEDQSSRIEVEIFGAGWVTDLERIILQDLDLGTYTYTKAQVETTWTESTPLAVPAPGYYGGWNTPGDVTRKDLRFWFNLYELMRLAFCEIGWQFESEYFQKAGASLYGYLGGDRWYSYADKSDVFRVDLNLAAPKALAGPAEVVIFDEASDPLNLYNNLGLGGRPSEYLYPPAGEIGIDLEIQIRSLVVTLPAAPAGQPIPRLTVLVYRNRPPQIEFIGYEEYPGPASGQQQTDIVVTFIDTDARAGDSYAIFFEYADENGTTYAYTMESADIVYSPNPPYYINDDTIDLAGTIDQDINALDLFKAMAHICNGKIETDEVLKTVRMFPPFSVDQESHEMKGFFKRDKPPLRIDDLVQENSMIRTNTKNDENRYVLLQFAQSTDSYIDQTGRKDQIYSRRIDRGAGKAEETKIENPLFEPTLEAEPDTGDTGTTSSATGLSLVALWDNIDGAITRKAGPRVAYWYGEIEQLDSAGTAIDWSWEGGLRTLLPYLSMAPVRPMTGNPTIYPVVFADRQYDLWRLFYRRWLQENQGTTTYEILANINLDAYRNINFREMLAFFYRNTIEFYQPLNIKDYGTNETTSSVITLKKIICT